MAKVRRVLGPNGMTLMTFPEKTESKSTEEVIQNETEMKSEESINEDSAPVAKKTKKKSKKKATKKVVTDDSAEL